MNFRASQENHRRGTRGPSDPYLVAGVEVKATLNIPDIPHGNWGAAQGNLCKSAGFQEAGSQGLKSH